MASTYTLTLADGTTLADLTSLESNGVGSQSTPRQILDINFTAGVQSLVVADDVTTRFVPGFSFEIFGSVYEGTYTVHASGPSYLDGRTTIPVNEAVVFDDFVVSGVSSAGNYWKVLSAGNASCMFYPGSTLTITGNGFGAANTTYTVISSITSEANSIVAVIPGVGGTWSVSGDQTDYYDVGATFKVRGNGIGDGDYIVASSTWTGTNTDIVVTGTIPALATSIGVAILTPAFTKITVTPGSIPIGATVSGTATPSAPVQYALSAPPAIIVVSPGVFDITWHIAGNHASKFVTDCSFAIKGNSFYEYNVFPIRSVSFSLGNTHVTTRVSSAVTPTPDSSGVLVLPAPVAPFGYVQYTINEAATSLQLIGKGTPYFSNGISWGHAIMNNEIHSLEHFARNNPPVAPLVGQIWYDSSTLQHRALNDDVIRYDIVDVVVGPSGYFEVVGDQTANPDFSIGNDIIVYNNVGMGLDTARFEVSGTSLSGGNTRITSFDPIPLNATTDGVIYSADKWNGMVTANVPVLGLIHMNGFKITNLADATDPLDALNLQTGDARYVNVTGDTMTGDLTMATGADIFMTNGNIQFNGASNISFPLGTTGDILLAGANDITFSGTGIINMGGNKITNLGNATVGTDALNMNTGDSRYVNVTGDTMTGTLTMSGATIAMGNNKITGLADATVATDALNMQTGDARYVNITGDTMTGALTMGAGQGINMTSGTITFNSTSAISFPVGSTGDITLAGGNDITFTGAGQISMGTNKIVNLGTPTTGTDAATKAYVDGFVSGVIFLSPVKDPNIYSDALDTPPGSPVVGYRTYIVKPGAFTITGRVTGASGKWIISGNHAARFTAGNTFVVNGNSNAPSDGTYTVASAADVAATTEITITGTVPVASGTNGTVYHSVGAWNGKDGHAMVWDGSSWIDVLDRAVISGDRFGIYAEPDNDEVPADTSGMSAELTGNLGKIGTIQATVTSPGFTALGTAPAWSFYTPVEPDAFSVTGTHSYHFGHSYTFRGTYGSGTYNSNYKWIEFSGPSSIIDGAGLVFTGNTLNVGSGNAITVTANAINVADNPVLPGTASVTINTGTTGQRSGTPTNAMFRHNTTNLKFEGYENSGWRDFITATNGDVATNQIVYGTASGVVTSNAAYSVETSTLSLQHAAGNFAVAGDARTGQYVLKASTTDATVTEMLINGGTRLALSNDSTWMFHVQVVARRTDVDGESASYKFEGCIDRNANAASTALVGTVLSTILAEDSTAWDVTVDADTTNGSLRLRVTGEAAKSIRWVAFVRTVEVRG